MRRLIHDLQTIEAHGREPAHSAKKTGFFKMGAAAVLAASAIGCAQAVLPSYLRYSLPDEYYNQYSDSALGVYGTERVRQVSINGHTASIMIRFNPIPQLDSDSESYRVPALNEDGNYLERATVRDVILRRGDPVPGSPGQISVTTGSIMLGYAIQRDGIHYGFALFPESVDSAPAPASSPQQLGAGWSYVVQPGFRAVRTHEFADLFRVIAGEELRKVKLLIDNHLMDRNPCITVHVVGVDQSGNLKGRWQNGYLAFGMTYYPERNEVRSGLGLLVERRDLDEKK